MSDVSMTHGYKDYNPLIAMQMALAGGAGSSGGLANYMLSWIRLMQVDWVGGKKQDLSMCR